MAYRQSRGDQFHTKPMCALDTCSVERWLILAEYIDRNPITEPIYTPDWDVLIFQNLPEACATFLAGDGSSSMVGLPGNPNFWQNIHLLVNRRPLDVFKEVFTRNLVGCSTWLCDMYLWTEAITSSDLKIANLNVVESGSYFCPAITYDPGRYTGNDVFQHVPPQNEGEATGPVPSPKVIKWIHGRPHFLLRSTGEPIRANVVHCWGPLKDRTGELLADAIRGRHDA